MNLLLDLFFPKKCLGCNKNGEYFCKSCIENILQTDLVCPICERLALGGKTHPFCKSKFGLDGLWSLAIYQDTIRKAIKSLKYSWVSDLAQCLTNIVLEYWARYQPFLFEIIKKDKGIGWVIVPVPLHWFRENQRGFNQSALIGKLLSKNLGLGYCEALERVRFTKPQVKIRGNMRHQNIKGAFNVSKDYDLKTMNYVLLIDDVWTTGSTLMECCYVLKKAGTKQVWALTLAR